MSSVEWGGAALSLLVNAKSLAPGKPAIMHIRHTERPGVTGPYSNTLPSTPRGTEAAVEFGVGLPSGRSYRLYHTVVGRSKQSAEAIMKGIRRRGGKAVIAGEFPFRTSFNPEAMDEYIDRVIIKLGDEDAAVAEMMNRWLAGLSPPDIFRPSGEFARLVADYAIERLDTATRDTVDLYVTHDTWVGSCLFHWFGIPIPLDGVRFLDGYILQPLENEMAVWYRGKTMRIEYPHWWVS